jgi:hypothetical protein
MNVNFYWTILKEHGVEGRKVCVGHERVDCLCLVVTHVLNMCQSYVKEVGLLSVCFTLPLTVFGLTSPLQVCELMPALDQLV